MQSMFSVAWNDKLCRCIDQHLETAGLIYKHLPGHLRSDHMHTWKAAIELLQIACRYLVTDRRINVGTSNMMWGYFYQV